MTLENQVVSFELAKRMKELGIIQNESEFVWIKIKNKYSVQYHTNNTEFSSLSTKEWEKACEGSLDAFTVAELGEMLSAGIVQKYMENNLDPSAKDVGIELNICPKWGEGDKRYVLYLAGASEYVKDDKEADARAKMLIYLKENKLI